MGNKQSSNKSTLNQEQDEDPNDPNLRIKRRLTHKSQSSSQINQPSSSPLVVKHPNQKSVINLNNELRAKQQDLTSAIKKIDSSVPTQHLSSKLYKPNSFLIATSLNTFETKQQPLLPNKPDLRAKQPIKNSNTIPSNLNENSLSPKNVRIAPRVVLNSPNSSKSKPANKIAKRFGLSPRFKRKIVETITNRVNSANNQNLPSSNQKFTQTRLFQALQSQWNLFTSMSHNLDKDGFEDDDTDYSNETNPFQRKRRIEHGSTFLSTSVERNSFRYASRRKYKSQSLVNPYRHADTNYPVYIHEALFMPEFSVKGQVTEADFEILDVISRGAFGHVIKVKKKSDSSDTSENGSQNGESQVYAMKIMWKSQVIRDRALQQVKDEVTIATNCVDNPLIVKTWFYWQSKRFLYIITDYVENGELLSLWLKVHHFPERLVAVYAIEMCLALDYLHKHGIIYRDIKMENILLDQRGHIQLIDFGLSKWLKLGEKTCTICGTIQYMAPEILSVEPYDHSVDWWSLGILIYALLSGEYPLNAAKDHIQMNEKVSKHIFELDQSSGKYSFESCDLVRKLLRKNPQRRLKSLNEIKQDAFFRKEISLFVNAFASENGKSREECELLANENYWNPYFVIENYSPLQLLFDEIYALKNKQKIEKSSERIKPKQRTQAGQSKPQTLNINTLSSSSSSSSSVSATRTTNSLPNTSSDDIVEDVIESNESSCSKVENKFDLGEYGDDENDQDDVNYDDENDINTSFTKF